MKIVDDLGQGFAWLGSVGMTVLGGVVAYIRSYEAEEAVRLRTPAQHGWALLRKALMSFFVGLVYYYGAGKFVDPPLSMAFAGVVGCFGAEFLELMWRVFVARFPTQKARNEHEN